MRSETNSIESKNVWWQHFKNVLSLVQLHQPIRKSLRTHTLTAAAAFARIIAVLIFVKCSWKFSLCVCQFLRAWVRWLAQHCAVPWHPRHGTTWILECFDFFFLNKTNCDSCASHFLYLFKFLPIFLSSIMPHLSLGLFFVPSFEFASFKFHFLW